jgi:hypothetical protein
LARRVSSTSSESDNLIASLIDVIIVYKWLLQSTSTNEATGTEFHKGLPSHGSPFLFRLGYRIHLESCRKDSDWIHQGCGMGNVARIRWEKSEASPAAWAASLIHERRRSSANGSVGTSKPAR